MAELFFLTQKEKQVVLDLLFNYYQFSDSSVLENFSFLSKKKDDSEKIYLLSKEFADLNFESFKIDSMGMYFCEMKFGEIRLSLEGSHLIGKYCKKNVFELNSTELENFMLGNDFEVDIVTDGFYLIKNNDDFFGSSKIKSNLLLNFLPKERRIGSIIN